MALVLKPFGYYHTAGAIIAMPVTELFNTHVDFAFWDRPTESYYFLPNQRFTLSKMYLPQ